jgi:methionine--tRNA ligase beta chain
MITIDDFTKIDIRIGKVLSAERVPEADKLLKLIFDFGDEQRQVMAGIAEHIEDPDTLVGKEMPVIINLEPRKLRGYESHGMILAASDAGRPTLLHPAQEVAPGSSVG